MCFSGGVDSGSVFLLIYHAMIALGLSPARLKAFVLDAGGPDVAQARAFLQAVGLELFLEAIPGDPAGLDPAETLAVIEDYKPLDVECASVGLQLCRGIRARYPEWRHLADGDGGDENLKDYPIEENPELTIRSVVDNLMLYQEGWGVGRIKHSLTYSGGLSRSYVRTYAPARRYGFDGFSPLAQPGVLEVAEGIPFAELTGYDVPTLYRSRARSSGAACGRSRTSRCRRFPSGASSTARSTRTRCARSSARRRGRRRIVAASSACTGSRWVGAIRRLPGRTSGARSLRARSPRSAARGRSMGAAPRHHRSRARRPRRRRRRRHAVPHRPRVPVALRDVRPLARHDRDRHAARRDPAPDRARARGLGRARGGARG